VDSHSEESTGLRGRVTPMGEKLLDLTHALFSIEVSKAGSTVFGRAINNIIGCMSIVATFVDHSLVGLLLDLLELGVGEEAIRERVADAGEKDGKVVGVGLTWGEGSLTEKGGSIVGFGQ